MQSLFHHLVMCVKYLCIFLQTNRPYNDQIRYLSLSLARIKRGIIRSTSPNNFSACLCNLYGKKVILWTFWFSPWKIDSNIFTENPKKLIIIHRDFSNFVRTMPPCRVSPLVSPQTSSHDSHLYKNTTNIHIKIYV